jgi:ribosomal protein S6--L-glutamate ligase
MKILYVGLKKKRQILRVREEAEKRGHSVDGCYPSELIISGDAKKFEAKLSTGQKLSDYDLIYVIAGRRLWEWYTACLYVHKNFGTIIVNNKAIDPSFNFYHTPAIDYLRETEEGLPYPKSAIIFSPSSLNDVSKEFKFPVIVKASMGHRGMDVYKVESRNKLEIIVSELTDDIKSCVIREFIPNDGDFRIFCVGYKAIGGMFRTPKKGDFRSNISQGGSAKGIDLKKYPKIIELAEKAAKLTRTEIAGVDIILDKKTKKPYILEVNSGPQIDGLESTGVNVAGSIVKYFEELHTAKKQ